MLIYICVEQAAMRESLFMRFENVIKDVSVEAAKERSIADNFCFKPENIKEIRPATLEDIERLYNDFDDEGICRETELRDAEEGEIAEREAWINRVKDPVEA